MALRLRRGTDAERSTVTPLSGELIYTTDTNRIYVGDGTTVGGNLIGPPLTSSFDLVNDTTPQLGGNLDLNGNDITGTGNINITGTITATGNINLGDGAEDNIIVGGVITSSLVPGSSDTYDLGSASNRWRQLHVNGVAVDGEITALSYVGNILADDSTVAFDSANGSFTGNLTGNVTGNLTGDIIGSLFADNSTVVVDGLNGNIHTNTIISDTEFNLDVNGNVSINRAGLSVLYVNNNQPTVDLSTGSTLHGILVFRTSDVNGVNSSAVVGSAANGFSISKADASFALPNTHKLFIGTDGNFGFGTITPSEKFDFVGNVKTSGFVQFGPFTKTERDGLTASNGMVLYNTTSNRFQGYQNGAWINLDDGTADP